MPFSESNKAITQVVLPIRISLTHLNTLLQTHLSSIDVGAGQRIAKIKILQFSPICHAELLLDGTYDGFMDAKFQIVLNEEKQSLEFKDVDLKLRSTGLLAKGLNWLADSVLHKQISESLQSNLDQALEHLFSEIIDVKRAVPLPENFVLNVDMEAFKVLALNVNEKSLELTLFGEGKLSIISKEFS